MAQTITVPNFPEKNISELALLNADVAPNLTSIVVQNNESITLNSHIILGRLGSETAELVQVTDIPVDATNLVVSPITLQHYKFDNVTAIIGNKLSIYRATAPTDGTIPADAAFASIVTLDLDVDQLSTTYTDTTGGVGYWYKVTYKDSISGTESGLDTSSAVRGGGLGDYTTVEAIRQEAGFQKNTQVTDDLINQKRQAAQAEVNSKLAARYSVPFTAPVNPYIVDITTRLAAGFVRLQQFGDYGTVVDNPAKAKIQQARDDLKELQEGTATLQGVTGSGSGGDTGGGGSGTGASGGFDGWPNATTATATYESSGGEHMFRVGDVTGQGRY